MKKKLKYSAIEKKAYYTGLGVGLTGNGPSSNLLTRKAVDLMTDKEFNSYLAGYEKGLDNSSIRAGIRKKNKWF